MFNSPILNLVILLSFTYFVVSIMLSAISESFSALLKTRAKDLKTTLENLLQDPDWKTYVNNSFFNSKYILSLMNNKNQPPSYIPARSFLNTIIEAITAQNYTVDNLSAGINNAALPTSMKNLLNDIWAKAQNNATPEKKAIVLFEEGVETFYNDAMDRATGWYKRKTRRMMLVLGFLLVAILNIDTIKITQNALSDKDRLDQTVDKIVQTLPYISVNDSITIKSSDGSILIRQIIDSIKTNPTKKTDSAGIKQNIDTTIKKIKQLEIIYNNMGLYQMGYKDYNQFSYEWFATGEKCHKRLISFLLKILGLMLTAFAIQLGSNYWFDFLNKAVNLRATGKKPLEKV